MLINYVKEETKRDELRVVAGKRDKRFEERNGRRGDEEILYECLRKG